MTIWQFGYLYFFAICRRSSGDVTCGSQDVNNRQFFLPLYLLTFFSMNSLNEAVFALLIKLTSDLLFRKSELHVLKAVKILAESTFLMPKSLLMCINAVLKCEKRWNQIWSHCHSSTSVPDYLSFYYLVYKISMTCKVGWKGGRLC